MIRQESKLKVADNSGAKLVQCIRILGSTGKKYASVGDEIIVVVKKAIPGGRAKKKEIFLAVIVRAKKERKRSDGTYIRFSDNAVVLFDEKKEIVSSRINMIAREALACSSKMNIADEIF